jgi:nucleotide-binding universal stress UspA family protein
MSYLSAIQDFRQARRRAALEQIMARLTRRSADLLSYQEVRQKLKLQMGRNVGLQEIPLDSIVGSVGRYTDFTRTFLPKSDDAEERWARVQMKVTDLGGLPAIEVYQIDQVYFVLDGNHRVSVARQLGATHIQAYVTEIVTRVPLTPDIQPDDLILKAEYTDFLERTSLDEICPDADLSVSVPGQYEKLMEHISVHRYFMGLDQHRPITCQEAVAHWYQEVYLPVVQVIRQMGILRDFPGRTETDLYLWIMEHRSALQDSLGWEIGPEDAAGDLASKFSRRPQRVVARVSGGIRDAVLPDGFEAGPPAGQWREERLVARREDRLFADILVAVNGASAGWRALDQALELARHEQARLRGLHIVPEARKNDDKTLAVQAEFKERCDRAGVDGKLAIETGKVARAIADRARWADLVVVSLAYPPGRQPVAKLGSGFRTLLRLSPRPVLAVPGKASLLSRPLLAFDSSPKAREALFIGTYIAGQWESSLTVVGAYQEAREYLEMHDVQATFVPDSGPPAESILNTAQQQACDLILMGSYGYSPVVELALGSALDQVLRRSPWPILICR